MKKMMRFEEQKSLLWLYRAICTIFLVFLIGIVLHPIIAFADNGNTIVHVTSTGKCYHCEGCYHLRSDYEITLYEAVVENGYNPCEDCNPPIYDGPELLHKKMEKSQGGQTDTENKSRSTTKTSTVTRSVEEKEDNKTSKVVVGVIAAIIGIFVVNFILETYSNIRESWKKKKAEKEYYEAERKKYVERYSDKDPITLVDVPAGSFIKDGLPCTNDTSNGIYGKYTVYVAKKQARVLHVKATCGANLRPINYYYACKLPHCKKCATGYKINLPEIDWYSDYIEIVNIKKKYNIP